MITLSTNELRTNFQGVLKALSAGNSFVLMYRSQPVAEIHPNTNVKSLRQATDEDLIKSQIQDLSEDFCSPAEQAYYLNLK